MQSSGSPLGGKATSMLRRQNKMLKTSLFLKTKLENRNTRAAGTRNHPSHVQNPTEVALWMEINQTKFPGKSQSYNQELLLLQSELGSTAPARFQPGSPAPVQVPGVGFGLFGCLCCSSGLHSKSTRGRVGRTKAQSNLWKASGGGRCYRCFFFCFKDFLLFNIIS